MKIYNTLTRRIETIDPIEHGKLKMYSCGPTVYRYIHIGNLRTFTMADWIRRTFEYRGYEVLHVKNITDVGHMRQEAVDRGEDKILAQARKEGKTSLQIAQFYTEAFHDDEAKLNILPASIFPRATQHIPEMIAIIAGLLAKGIAYEVNGYIYYDIKRFPGYGKLSGNQLENMLAGVREGVDTDRHNPEDFPLWKPAEEGREMAWDSPWGRGFPGWHIECSAMSMKYLGPRFDVHTGGVDNIFPHHEGELAQSEGYTGQPFVSYWVHAQHLLADGLKMAKSTGNAYTLTDVEARGYDPMELRYLFTTAHYRSRLNFTFGALKAAQIGFRRLRQAVGELATDAAVDPAAPPRVPEGSPLQQAFAAALAGDLNVPRALAVVWDVVRRAPTDLSAQERLALVLDFDRVLGLGLDRCAAEASGEDQRATALRSVPAAVRDLVDERARARRGGDYAVADDLRARIGESGY